MKCGMCLSHCQLVLNAIYQLMIITQKYENKFSCNLASYFVDHVADIGFVDAHAKGDGGDDDEAVFDLKTAFGVAAIIRVHARVIVDCCMARGA